MSREYTKPNATERAVHPRKEKTAPASERTEATAVYHDHRKPVSLEAIASAGGIAVCPRGDLPRKIHGIYFQTGNERIKAIMVNSRYRRQSRRFTLGHELAHAAHFAAAARPDLCDSEDISQWKEENPSALATSPKERLCDQIAMEVLMPADLLLRSIFAAGTVDAAALAHEYDVSVKDARTRLQGLGLL